MPRVCLTITDERVWLFVLLALTLPGLGLGALGAVAATMAISLFGWDLATPMQSVGVTNCTDLPGERLYRGQWTVMMAAVLISVAPIVLAFFFGQKQFIQGIALTGVK